MLRPTLAAVLATGLLAAAPAAAAQSTAAAPQPGVRVGQLAVSGATWDFSGDLANEGGPWGSVTITNTNCTSPYRPGTAQAGAVIFTAPLGPAAGAGGPAPLTGNLQGFKGSAATGQVRLAPLADTGGTHVEASLTGLEPFVAGTTLSVCLALGTPPPLLAQISVDQQQVAATNFDVTGVATAATDTGQTLIAISGTQGSAGTLRRWVFFFLGAGSLGTDTGVPSTSELQLVGSPGQDQLDVSYADPDGGAPVTITYTLTNGALEASGTPPGH
jgi:hypothetical protein